MKSLKRSLVLVLGFALAPLANAQSVTTEPVGFMTDSLLGNSDTFISLPLLRPAAFVGGIQSAAGTTITVSGNPWTANQFVYAPGTQPNRYYALVGPASSANPKEGHTYPITANGTNTLTVQLGQDTLAGIPANAQVSVIPNWTLSTVFPAADQNVSFTPTTDVAQYKTQVRVPDVSQAGTNLPYTTYYFSNNANGSGQIGWRLVGDNITNRGDDALLPDSHFVVRNLNGSPTLPLVNLGGVLLKKLTVPLMTNPSLQQDNPVSILRPLDVALNATGLKMSDGSFRAGDQLLLFNNAQVGLDKSPSAVYVQTAAANGPWRLSTDPANDRGNDIIPAGTGFIIRKATGSGQPDFWTNSFPVQAISAVSRLTHGAAGDFDLPLPLSGNPAVECRFKNGDYKIVFTFPSAVTFTGAAVTTGSVTSTSATSTAADTVTVNLSGVVDVQRITVTLLDVNDGSNTNNVAVRMGLLVGDTSGNGTVNGTDISQTKSQSGIALSASNFRLDVNASGGISASDVSFVKSKSGGFLPAAGDLDAAESKDSIAAR